MAKYMAIVCRYVKDGCVILNYRNEADNVSSEADGNFPQVHYTYVRTLHLINQ